MVFVSSQNKRGWLGWGLEGGSSTNDTIQAPLLCNGARFSFVFLKYSR